MAINPWMRERIEAYARELSEEFGEVDDGAGDCWLDAVESRAMEIGDAVTAALVAAESAERPVAAEAACPQCGRRGRCTGHRRRELVTRRGPATIAEPEYYCPCCRKAFFPADGRAGR